MKLTFLGTGSAFTSHNWQTNILVDFPDGYKMLIDCGGDARFSLAEVGLSYLDIDGVYISHLHADHTGGLEWLAFTTKFDPRYRGKPDLFISEFLVEDLWARTLSGGLASMQNQINTLDSYFNVHTVPRNGTFKVSNHVDSPEFRLVQTIHVLNGFTIVPSFGLMFASGGKKVFITTDTQHAPNQINDFYQEADIIFQDCESTPFKTGVHAHFSELVTLHENIRKKMWLCHYSDNVLVQSEGWAQKAEEAGFLGFIKKQQVFEF